MEAYQLVSRNEWQGVTSFQSPGKENLYGSMAPALTDAK